LFWVWVYDAGIVYGLGLGRQEAGGRVVDELPEGRSGNRDK